MIINCYNCFYSPGESQRVCWIKMLLLVGKKQISPICKLAVSNWLKIRSAPFRFLCIVNLQKGSLLEHRLLLIRRPCHSTHRRLPLFDLLKRQQLTVFLDQRWEVTESFRILLLTFLKTGCYFSLMHLRGSVHVTRGRRSEAKQERKKT